MNVLAFGEVLWDKICGKEYIGGAPFNFTAHCKKMGANSYLFSAIGNDSLGRKTMEIIKEKGMCIDFIKIVNKPTCVVKVSFNSNNSPYYNFPEMVSWDYMDINESEIASINKLSFDFFYFGTLSQRSSTSSRTIIKLLNKCNFKNIFLDMNLRDKYYSKDKIEYSLKKCNILKINNEEAYEIKRILKINASKYKKFANIILRDFDIKIICITAGEKGAYISDKNDFIYCPGCKTIVKDTIGSGDAFSAALITKIYEGLSLKDACEYANKVGALVSSSNGAVPEYDIKSNF